MSGSNQGAFVHTFADLASANSKAENLKAQIIADIVIACRDSAEQPLVPLFTYTVEHNTEVKDDDGNDIVHAEQIDFTYGDVLKLALGEDADYKGKKATKWFDRVIATAPAGRTLLSNIARLSAEAADLEKRDGLLRAEAARLDVLKGKKKDNGKREKNDGELGAEKQKRNTLVTALTRAFKVAAYVVEIARHNEDKGAPLATLTRHNAALSFSAPTGDELEDGSPEYASYPLQVTACADHFAAHYAEWTKPASKPEPETDSDTAQGDDTDSNGGEPEPDAPTPDVTTKEGADEAKGKGKGTDKRNDGVDIDNAPSIDVAKGLSAYIGRHRDEIANAKGETAQEWLAVFVTLRDAIDHDALIKYEAEMKA